ncbi:MAG: hypothetical protein COA57_05900 [Flavobacteriales bacterium]|nr:MAG: hypothetical protein COA57_05900 [Flavobacteriales bacterium]
MNLNPLGFRLMLTPCSMEVWEIWFNFILLLFDSWLVFQIFSNKSLPNLLAQTFVFGILSIILAFYFSPNNFGVLRLAAWVVFVHGLLVFFALAVFRKQFRTVSLFISVTIIIVGIDAFLIEPHWLEISRYEIKSNKIKKSLKIVVLADLQTDEITDYERMVIGKVMAENPDMILMPGDFVHVEWGEKRTKVLGELNQLLKENSFHAPLGIYAVGGNTDECDWTSAFDDLPVTCFGDSYTLEKEGFTITGLHLWDSYDSNLHSPSPQGAAFHIVLGHVPDFALSNPDADLLVAGHTHGGQVQIPFFGPILTLCEIPRNWAEGMTEIDKDTKLLVSRGIGMERGNAPRLRFWCRPELVVITLIPA